MAQVAAEAWVQSLGPVQLVKNLALLQLWHWSQLRFRFDPCPRNLLHVQPKKKKEEFLRSSAVNKPDPTRIHEVRFLALLRVKEPVLP